MWRMINRTMIAFAVCVLPPLSALAGATAAQGRKARPADVRPEERIMKLANSGRYDEALLLAKRLLESSRKTLGPNHPDVAAALDNLGVLYQLGGDFVQAELHFKLSISVLEKARGPKHPELVTPLHNLAWLYYNNGDYVRPQPLFERQLAILEETFGAKHLAVAQALNDLGLAYYDGGDYARARPLLERSLKIHDELGDPDKSEVATSLNNLAELYKDTGEYALAEPLYERAVRLLEEARGGDNPESAVMLGTTLENFAELYGRKGDSARAEPLYERALDVLIKSVGPNDPNVVNALHRAARRHEAKGDYEQAEAIHKHALAVREAALGPDHPAVANSVNQLGSLYYNMGDYARAEKQFERAVRIEEKGLGPNHPALAVPLGNLASVYEAGGDYARAEPLYRRALTIREKAFSPDHPATAESLAYLAKIYMLEGDYARAEPTFERALSALRKLYGPEHTDVASALNNYASMYQEKADYTRAEALFEQALNIWKKVHGPQHEAVATGLNNLGELCRVKGEYARATQLLEQALTMREAVLGPRHPLYAQSLNNLAAMYEIQGDYARAEDMHKRALSIREAVLSPGHPDIGESLTNLGMVYLQMRDYDRAEKPLARAVAILEKVFGPDHPSVAAPLSSLAEVYEHKGDHARTESLLRRVLDARIKAYGPEHPDVATALSGLALFYGVRGDYARSESMNLQALAMRERTLSPDHPDVIASFNNLSWLYRAKGELAKAVQMETRGAEVREHSIAMVLGAGSENQKQLYLNQVAGWTDYPVSLHVLSAPQDGQAARLALTAILSTKGRALDAMSDQLGVLRRHVTPQAQTLLDQWEAALSQLATFRVSGGKGLTIRARQEKAAQLAAEVERLEGKVSRSSAEFHAQSQPVTLDAVRQAIPAGSALVEMVSYQPMAAAAVSADPKPHYVAYVLRRDEAVPRWVELGEAGPIDEAVARWLQALGNPPLRKRGEQISDADLQQRMDRHEAEVKDMARALDERVMRPVRKLLGETRHILLSPDGAMNLIPFAALVDEAGRYLLESYSITYLTSGRDLLRLQARTESRSAPVVVANPLYDLTVVSQPGPSASQATRPSARPNANQRSVDFTLKTYIPLPGTAEEAAALHKLWPDARVLTQEMATEAALKQVERPRVLHIATHGFFLPDQIQAAPAGDTPRRETFDILTVLPLSEQRENPLLRSGLLLAGVKQGRSGADDDGVLTALEVTGLDLWGTKLVTLSACETGLGDVQSGTGVYGLRRALVLAGSDAQVMSLWKVSDAGTRDLMVSYYKRLQKGAGRTEALRLTQLAMLRGELSNDANDRKRETADTGEEAASKDYRHPYYWAAFIQSGDWRNMDDQ
jgi:tetratricopeptide (TPR) repeat protein